MTTLRKKFIRDLQINNYSPHTVRNYVKAIERMSLYFNKCPSELSIEEIKDYLAYQVSLKKSWSYVNIIQSALKKLYTDTLEDPGRVELLKRPKLDKKVPYILSREEIVGFLDQCKIKYKVIFMIMYGCGLRVSEVAQLHIRDIDGSRMRLQVRHPKGHVQREVPMPGPLLFWLRYYIKQHPSKGYLFCGRDSITPLPPRAIQRVFSYQLKKSSINKPVTTHSLRHAFATHAMEEGSDLLALQKCLGHKSITTTMAYYHLTPKLNNSLVSPLLSLPKYGETTI